MPPTYIEAKPVDTVELYFIAHASDQLIALQLQQGGRVPQR